MALTWRKLADRLAQLAHCDPGSMPLVFPWACGWKSFLIRFCFIGMLSAMAVLLWDLSGLLLKPHILLCGWAVHGPRWQHILQRWPTWEHTANRDFKLCNDFKQLISLCCHVVVMLVVAFKELWTSAAEGEWQVSWQKISYRPVRIGDFLQCCMVCPVIYMVVMCLIVFILLFSMYTFLHLSRVS